MNLHRTIMRSKLIRELIKLVTDSFTDIAAYYTSVSRLI